VTVPVLAFFGELDIHTDVAEHCPVLEAALADNDDATVVVLPTANHL
jgi:hypothetical protein